MDDAPAEYSAASLLAHELQADASGLPYLHVDDALASDAQPIAQHVGALVEPRSIGREHAERCRQVLLSLSVDLYRSTQSYWNADPKARHADVYGFVSTAFIGLERDAFEVEFVACDGTTRAVLTLHAGDVRKAGPDDILAVRATA